MMMYKIYLPLAVLAGITFVSGCEPRGIPVSMTTATVVYQGKPVDGATVTFFPTRENNRGAAGLTDGDGLCYLITPGAKAAGCMPGRYEVKISKRINVDRKGKPVRSDTPDEKVVSKPVLPEKFEDAATSGLDVEVSRRGRNHFVFDLDR